MIMRMVTLAVLAGVLSGCAIFGRGNSASRMPTSGQVNDENREEELRALIRETLAEEQQANSPQSAKLVWSRPYYFREYVVYPDGTSGYELSEVASDSKSTPYVATVTLDMERYSTRLERKRDDAAEDPTFYASSGYEKRTYELRHGRWRETGTLFIAEESNAVPFRAAPGSVSSTAPPRDGLMNRLMFWRD